MKILRRTLILLTTLFSTACSQATFTAINLPTWFDNKSNIIHDVAFGPDDWEKLDIYMPADKEAQHDVVVFYHGGRWSYGDKDDYRFVGAAFAAQGFVTVIPNYRKYPDVRFPTFIEDGAKSLSWVADNISVYHGDSARIHLAGHSSGAHMAALLAADKHYLKAEGKDVHDVVRSFAGMAGPYDFTPDEPDLIDMFGPPAQYPQMQVTSFIDGTQPPMLLLYGAKDKAVKPYNLERLKARIDETGGVVQTIIYPDLTHVGIIGTFFWLGGREPVVTDIVNFFKAQDPAAASK